jgi:hypothetical protein
MMAKGKPRQVVVTAIARELAGFVWAIACITSDPPATTSTVAPASEEVGSTGRRTTIVSSRNDSQRWNEVARPGTRQEHARHADPDGRGKPEQMIAHRHSTG